MATIPKYERQVTSVATPNARVQATGDANSYGAGVANQFGQLANMATARAEEMQAEDDRNAVIQAKAALDSKLTDTLYHQDTGLMNQRGANALDITNRFNQEHDTFANDIASTLKTKRQQDVFNNYVMGQKDNYLRSVSSHQARERQVYTEENGKVAISSAKNLAIPNPYDQAIFDNSMDTISKTNKSLYGNLGDEVVRSKIAYDISDIRSRQITSMLSQGQGIAARDFAIAHKDEIDPKIFPNLYAGAEARAVQRESLNVADDVFNRFPNDQRAGMQYAREKYGNNQGFNKFESAIETKYTDAITLKNRESTDYRMKLGQQIGLAQTLTEKLSLIQNSDPNYLSYTEKIALERAARDEIDIENNPRSSLDDKHFLAYGRDGFFNDKNLFKQEEEMQRQGLDPTLEQKTKFENAHGRYDRYMDHITNGEYGRLRQAQSKYEQILKDLWDSKTSQERAQKANNYQSELNQLGQTLDRDVNNDVTYILNNGKG